MLGAVIYKLPCGISRLLYASACFGCAFRENSAAQKSEMLASNSSSSHSASEAVVMTTEPSHLSVASQPFDSLPTPNRGVYVHTAFHHFYHTTSC